MVPSCVLGFGIVVWKTGGGSVGGCVGGRCSISTTGWVWRTQSVRPMMIGSVRVTLFMAPGKN